MVPEIVIDGKKYTPAKPRAYIWRLVMEFDNVRQKLPIHKYIDEHAAVIALIFNRQEITADLIIENFLLEEIKPLYTASVDWMIEQINAKFEQLPNVTTPMEEAN